MGKMAVGSIQLENYPSRDKKSFHRHSFYASILSPVCRPDGSSLNSGFALIAERYLFLLATRAKWKFQHVSLENNAAHGAICQLRYFGCRVASR